MRKGYNKAAPLKSVPGECYFCHSSVENEAKFGKKYSKNGICIHYFCMLFSSGLSQQGRNDREGILGFLVPDIKKEARRAARLRCTYCKQLTASIGCVKTNCRTCFHFGCGVDNGVLNRYFDNFASYCFEHRQYQQVPLAEQKRYRAKKTKCVICMLTVFAQPHVETLRTPCCKANSWYHRDCLQRMASCSGLHYFKCPLCNNKDLFQKEMLEFGIYIPDRDAAWELEPNAYHELLERHNKCDVSNCCCSEGRSHSQKNTPWDIVLCDMCGHMGCHMQCGKLSSSTDEWVCDVCQEISAKCLSASKVKNKTKPSKRVACLPGSTSGCKRKISASESGTEEPKRVRLSLSGRHTSARRHVPSPKGSKENCNDEILGRRASGKLVPSSKKTLDVAKIKCSRRRSQSRHLSYYVLGDAKPNDRRVASLQTGRRSTSCLPVAGCSNFSRGAREGKYTSIAINSSEARALRAQQRGKRDDEDRLIPNDSMPKWLKNHLQQDIFTGRNLGVKCLSLIPRTHGNRSSMMMQNILDDTTTTTGQCLQNSASSSPMTRSRYLSALAKNENMDDKPQWHSIKHEFHTRSARMKKPVPVVPGFQLAPGVDSCQQPVSSGDRSSVPSGRGKHSSSFPSGHPGSLPLGHGATFQTQVASDSEQKISITGPIAHTKRRRGQPGNHPQSTTEVPKLRDNMKYWDFIQHLEDIGAIRETPSLLDRLSLYQQYLEGEYELLSFADIKSATLASDERDAHSPTPSHVSPNEMLKDITESGVLLWSPSSLDNPPSSSPSLTCPYSPSQSCSVLKTSVASSIHSCDEMPSSPEENYDEVLLLTSIGALGDTCPASPHIDHSVRNNPKSGIVLTCERYMEIDTLELPMSQSMDFTEQSSSANHVKMLPDVPTKTQPVDSEEMSQVRNVSKILPEEFTEPSTVNSEQRLQHMDHVERLPRVQSSAQQVDSEVPLQSRNHPVSLPQESAEAQSVQSELLLQLRNNVKTLHNLPAEQVDFEEPLQKTALINTLSGECTEALLHNTDAINILTEECPKSQPVEEPLPNTNCFDPLAEESNEPQLPNIDSINRLSEECTELQPMGFESLQNTYSIDTLLKEYTELQRVDFEQPLENTDSINTLPEECPEPQPVDFEETLENTDSINTLSEECPEPQAIDCTLPLLPFDCIEALSKEPLEPQSVDSEESAKNTDYAEALAKVYTDHLVDSAQLPHNSSRIVTQPAEPTELQLVDSHQPLHHTNPPETLDVLEKIMLEDLQLYLDLPESPENTEQPELSQNMETHNVAMIEELENTEPCEVEIPEQPELEGSAQPQRLALTPEESVEDTKPQTVDFIELLEVHADPKAADFTLSKAPTPTGTSIVSPTYLASNEEEDDCVIIKIEDVRTLRPSDPHHIEIEEIATVPGNKKRSLSRKTFCRPIVIKADEISTIPGTRLIDLTGDLDDIIETVGLFANKEKRCADCGKIRRRRCHIKKARLKLTDS